MFFNDLQLQTNQLISIVVGGSTNFTIINIIKRITKGITANEHVELYERSTSKLEGVIDQKLETQSINLEDHIAVEVDRILKALNWITLKVTQVQQMQSAGC